MRRPRVIFVDGNVAAGKSALIREVSSSLRAAGLRVRTVPEPVDEWEASGALAAFYRDPAGFGYSFETYSFATRAKALREALEVEPDADVIMAERSPFSDQIFAALLPLGPLERAMHAAWRDLAPAIAPACDPAGATVLLLKTGLSACHDRLRSRGRASERVDEDDGGVTAQYQERLDRAHSAYFLGEDPLGEFASLGRSPFRSVVVVPPDIADTDFRSGPARDTAVARVCELLRLGRPE